MMKAKTTTAFDALKMIALPLVCHRDTPNSRYRMLTETDFSRERQWLFHYGIEGDIERLRLIGKSRPAFTDGLWRNTCFEAFIKARHSRGYHEFNFSPSGNWALYRFDDYRQGMTSIADHPPPRIEVQQNPNRLDIQVNVRPAFAADLASIDFQLALSAVLEDRDGTLSYWALAHPPGKPDFHHADGFVISGETR